MPTAETRFGNLIAAVYCSGAAPSKGSELLVVARPVKWPASCHVENVAPISHRPHGRALRARGLPMNLHDHLFVWRLVLRSAGPEYGAEKRAWSDEMSSPIRAFSQPIPTF